MSADSSRTNQQANGHHIAQASDGSTAIAGDGQVTGDDSPAQMIKAEGNISHVIQIGKVVVQSIDLATLLLIALAGVAALSFILLQRRTSCDYPAGWIEYTVRQGDTIWNLATSHYIPPSTLSKGNCLTSNFLEPGQVIFVPATEDEWRGCGGVPVDWVQATVEPTQTLHYLALGYDVNLYELAYVNCLHQFQVQEGQVIWVPPRPFDVAARLSAFKPRGISTYMVQAGDTIESVAAAHNLQPETIIWANDVFNVIDGFPDLLQIGQELIVIPVDGVYHLAEAGETVESIAEQYQVEVSAITELSENQFLSLGFDLIPGQHIIVPGAEKPYIPRVVAMYTGPVPEGVRGTGKFQWPVLGVITQGYWYGHRAIDLGAPTGSAVLATDGGFVSFAGWTDVGYGYLIVIDHVNGLTTYYGHLGNIYVSEGQVIERGQVIGAVGSTGWSTGPHLHFEVRYYGVQQKPRAYLP